MHTQKPKWGKGSVSYKLKLWPKNGIINQNHQNRINPKNKIKSQLGKTKTAATAQRRDNFWGFVPRCSQCPVWWGGRQPVNTWQLFCSRALTTSLKWRGKHTVGWLGGQKERAWLVIPPLLDSISIHHWAGLLWGPEERLPPAATQLSQIQTTQVHTDVWVSM